MSWQLSEPSPALVVHPPAVSLDEAHGAIELWEYYSRKTLDSAQRLAVELMMAEGPDGRWAAQTTGRCEPRQNGKGDEIEVVEAWGLIQRGEWIVHSAHEMPMARSAHRRLVDFLEGHRDLRRLVKKALYGNSDRSIELNNGSIIAYRTRTTGGGRGLDDISRIVIDEAQFAQAEHLASVMPIMAANPNPQTNFAGSAGIADKSDWWWSLRRRALAVAAGEEDPGEFAFLEHSAEKVELTRDGRVISVAPNPEDVEARARANPAYGVRISEKFMAEELRTLGPELFAREHLGVWDPYPGDTGGFLPYDAWQDLVIDAPKNQKSLCYGLSVSDIGGTIASASRLANGDLYVDTIKSEAGTDWIAPYLTDRFRRRKIPVRVNPAGPEGAFIRPLTETGIKVVEVTGRQYQQACGEFLDTVKNGTIRHLGQTGLNRAVQSAQRRDVGKDGSWVWVEPSSGVDLGPLKAATLALSGVTAKRPPRIYTLEKE